VEEKELAERLLAGDPAALAVLVESYHRPLFRFLWHATGSWHDAEDLTSQAIMRAIRDIRGFRGEGSLKAWIFQVAHREFLGFRRRQGIVKLLTPKPQTEAPPPSEDIVILSAALGRLSIPHRETFLLVEVEGFTTEEAATALRTSPGTIKSRNHYAKLRLRELLAPAYPEVSNHVAHAPE
jgi:RNA polymerase sigma-70 factor (ECF subfamily)